MPSDSKKKRDAKRKEAKATSSNGSQSTGNSLNVNSKKDISTTDLTVEGLKILIIICISSVLNFLVLLIFLKYVLYTQLLFLINLEALCKKLEEDARIAAEARAVTGVLG